MTEKTSVFDVAQWFLDKEDISPKRLQKLVYYVQAWSYALFDKPFIFEDDQPAVFEAWQHGPVNPTLYHEYSGYGWHKIHLDNADVKIFTNMDLDLLESVWETYGDYSPNEIENLTHQEDPWKNARKRDNVSEGEYSKEIISSNDMREYYSSIYIGD